MEPYIIFYHFKQVYSIIHSLSSVFMNLCQRLSSTNHDQKIPKYRNETTESQISRSEESQNTELYQLYHWPGVHGDNRKFYNACDILSSLKDYKKN